MKKKLLGLGICALALGAFAGAVSAQRALEVKAALPATVYVDVSALDWFGNAGAKAYAYVFNDDYSIKNADYPGAEMESVSEGLYSVTIPSGATKLAILRMNPGDLTESGIWNKSADIALEADKDYLTITALGNGTSTSAWSIKGDGYRLVGLGSFDYEDSIASEETENNDKFQKTNLALEAGNKFKISFADTEAEAIKWGENYGFTALTDSGLANDASANFEADGDNNIVVSEGKGGDYDIYLSSAGKIYIFEHSEPTPVVYSAKLGDAAIALEEIAPSHEDMAAQYHAVIDAAKDASITLYADGSLITSNVASDDGSSVKYASAGVFNVHNAIDDADLYIKVWKSGYVTLWADGLVEYNGYYLLSSSGSFLVENGIASNGAHGDNVATFINVSLAKDEELIIGKFTDGARDAAGTWQYDAGWSNVDGEHSDAIAKFEVGTDNHIKVKEAGQFCIYVHADKATFINNYQATPADYTAVDTFVANYITEQAKPAKVGDSCETKYTEAAAALNALTEVQQDLFWKDAKYASERATFEYWRDHRNGSTIYSIEGVVKKDNTALVVTLVALAGAAVVGASIFFATRKKHN